MVKYTDDGFQVISTYRLTRHSETLTSEIYFGQQRESSSKTGV